MNYINRVIPLIIFTIVLSCEASSQNSLDKKYIDEIVNKISDIYSNEYVFPEKGKAVATTLRSHLNSNHYYNAPSYDSLATLLKSDIISVTNDKHPNVIYKGKSERVPAPEKQSPVDFLKAVENYGLTNIEIKEGNIGYVKILVFFPIQMDPKSLKAVDAMMQKFKECSSIIFDLTSCRGGDPNMISHMVTYLYPEGKKIHLNDFFHRPSGNTMSTFTKDDVPGPRFPTTPVYVLTSKKTFSAGEEFSYDLKHLNRATIIGEITGGGAHAVEPRQLDENFDIMIPTGRAINPITKTNWEGTGVEPNILVEASLALEKAITIIHNN